MKMFRCHCWRKLELKLQGKSLAVCIAVERSPIKMIYLLKVLLNNPPQRISNSINQYNKSFSFDLIGMCQWQACWIIKQLRSYGHAEWNGGKHLIKIRSFSFHLISGHPPARTSSMGWRKGSDWFACKSEYDRRGSSLLSLTPFVCFRECRELHRDVLLVLVMRQISQVVHHRWNELME